MREIKFRGKRLNNGEWIYGYYIVASSMCFISTFGVREPIAVNPKTIGQYTGLQDKNGVEIYEGDRCVGYYRDEELIGTIIFVEELSCFMFYNDDDLTYLLYEVNGIEVVGNIHQERE